MKIRKIAFLFLLSLLLAFSLSACDEASALDFIENYDITVTPQENADLSMRVHIRWRVLDSTSEGPLTWVKIGIPNCNATAISAESGNIRETIRNGEYIEVYFDREYVAGEVVEFSFSWLQSYMFTVTDAGKININYTPGWFDEIRVGALTLTVNGRTQERYEISNGTDRSTSDAVILTAENLDFGEQVNIDLLYPIEAFPTIDYRRDAEHAEHDDSETVAAIVSGFFVLFFIFMIFAVWYSDYRSRTDPQYWTGGYEGDPIYATRHSHFFFFPRRYGGFAPPPGRAGTKPPPSPPTSGGHSSGHSCACACACACAGGGRAGCSRKNIRGAVLNVEAAITVLEKGIEKRKNP